VEELFPAHQDKGLMEEDFAVMIVKMNTWKKANKHQQNTITVGNNWRLGFKTEQELEKLKAK